MVFSVLLSIIVYQGLRGRGYFDRLTVFIAVLSLINGCLAVITCYESMNVFEHDRAGKLFKISLYAEAICFFSVIWLFGIRFYETVINLESIISFVDENMSIESLDTR